MSTFTYANKVKVGNVQQVISFECIRDSERLMELINFERNRQSTGYTYLDNARQSSTRFEPGSSMPQTNCYVRKLLTNNLTVLYMLLTSLKWAMCGHRLAAVSGCVATEKSCVRTFSLCR